MISYVSHIDKYVNDVFLFLFFWLTYVNDVKTCEKLFFENHDSAL